MNENSVVRYGFALQFVVVSVVFVEGLVCKENVVELSDLSDWRLSEASGFVSHR